MKKIEKTQISQIKYDGITIPYIINYGKRKNMYICIKECEVTVKVPINISEKRVQDFIKTKVEWIYKSIQKQEVVLENKIKYENGEQIKILGQTYTLQVELSNKKRSTINIENKNIIIKINEQFKNQPKEVVKQEIKKQIEKLYESIAKNEVEGAMEEITSIVGLRPNEYRIKKLKRAWGNCSSKKIISINMEVVKFQREFIQYVVLHEVCHLKYMNHSKMFWNMVEKYMPNYKEIKKLQKGDV